MPLSHDNLVQNIHGVVFPIPVPFSMQGDVDHDGLENYVRFLIDSGAKTIMVTVGTSRFHLLTEAEMLAVNETVTRCATGKATVIVTGPPTGPVRLTRRFADHAAACGADAMLVVYPDRFYSEEGVFNFFRSVSESSPLPIMIHLKAMPAGRGGLPPQVHTSVDLLQRLAALDNIVGMKEESLDAGMVYAYSRALSDAFAIIGGAGGMRAHLTASMWGQRAYLAGIGNFAPKIELAFVDALEKGNKSLALRIVNDLEAAFFRVAIPLGWHVALKEAMHGLGLMSPEERLPMVRVEPGARERIRLTAKQILQETEEVFDR